MITALIRNRQCPLLGSSVAFVASVRWNSDSKRLNWKHSAIVMERGTWLEGVFIQGELCRVNCLAVKINGRELSGGTTPGENRPWTKTCICGVSREIKASELWYKVLPKKIPFRKTCDKFLLWVKLGIHCQNNFRSSYRRCSIKQVFWKISQNSQKKTPVSGSLF